METNFRVLSDTDRDQVHDKTVKILAETGVRVESDLGRDYLKKAGAEVDENTKMRELRRTIDAIESRGATLAALVYCGSGEVPGLTPSRHADVAG